MQRYLAQHSQLSLCPPYLTAPRKVMFKLKSGKILIVGDGNFSFSVAFRQRVDPSVQITTSCLQPKSEIDHLPIHSENIKHLENAGVTVVFGVDATQMEQNANLEGSKFERVIFNFPHVGGKSNIKKNRLLLKDFFASAVHMLSPDGNVCVSLCGGQGGTPADTPVRAWSDSWQVVAMAAESEFVLRQIWPFSVEDYPAYNSTGYRGWERSFFTRGAKTYVFEKPDPSHISPLTQSEAAVGFKKPNNLSLVENSASYRLDKVSLEDGGIQVFPHIARKLGRNLHEKSGHPVSLVSQYLTTLLSACPEFNTVDHVQDSGLMVDNLGHNPPSAAYVVHKAADTDSDAPRALHLHNGTDLKQTDSLVITPKYIRTTMLETIIRNLPTLKDRVLCLSVGEVCSRTGLKDWNKGVVQSEMCGVIQGCNLKEPLQTVLQTLLNCECEYSAKPDASDPRYHPFLEEGTTLEICTTFQSRTLSCLTSCNQVKATGSPAVVKNIPEVCPRTVNLGFIATLNNIYTQTEREVSLFVLHLNQIAEARYDIPDPRLLWSTQSCFLDQFCRLKPEEHYGYEITSLYPPLWRHDISFWKDPDREFDEDLFLDIVADLSCDLIQNVILMNVWTDPETGRVSRCYRTVYQSCEQAAGHSLAHQFQNVIRLTVADVMGVELR